MKNTKKIVALIMAIALIAVCGFSALAATVNQDGLVVATPPEVKGTVAAPVTVYKFDITWGDFEKFAYDWGTWDGTQYTGGVWNNTGTSSLKVLNKSNADISYAATFSATDAKVSGAFTNTTATLARADETAGTKEVTSVLSLTGAPTSKEKVDTAEKIGTITVTLSDPAANP